MPTLRTTKNAVMALNMQISCRRICTVKNNFIECECPHSPDVFLQQNLPPSYAALGPNIAALVTAAEPRRRRQKNEN
jgi:hypothetical protein